MSGVGAQQLPAITLAVVGTAEFISKQSDVDLIPTIIGAIIFLLSGGARRPGG